MHPQISPHFSQHPTHTHRHCCCPRPSHHHPFPHFHLPLFLLFHPHHHHHLHLHHHHHPFLIPRLHCPPRPFDPSSSNLHLGVSEGKEAAVTSDIGYQGDLVAISPSVSRLELEDWREDLELEEEEEGDDVFVLTDEWKEFFAKSEAKRRLKKQQRKKASK